PGTAPSPKALSTRFSVPFPVHSFFYSFSDLSISIYNIFCCCQGEKSHRSSGVDLLRADSDLRTETEFISVGKTRGGIRIDSDCVHFLQKSLCVKIIVGDNRLGMTGIVPVDVFDRLVQGRHGLDGRSEEHTSELQ